MTWSTVVFLAVVAWVLAGVVAAGTLSSPNRRAGFIASAIGALGWLVLSGLPTFTGLVSVGGPFPPQPILIVGLVGAVWLGSSGVGGRIAAAIPLWALVGFQGFRLPLEVVLHDWVESGIAPPQMTWTGQNWDILAGALALLSVPFVARAPKLAWIPTVFGSLLLLNILRIVATSLPGPLQRFDDTILLPFMFPHVWIGTICVTGAIAGHIIAFRALATRPARTGNG